MARVYAFETHHYEHRQQAAPTRAEYVFPKGEVREVPDEVARIVCEGAPTKLKLLGEFEPPPGSETVQAAPAPEQQPEPAEDVVDASPESTPEPKKPTRKRR